MKKLKKLLLIFVLCAFTCSLLPYKTLMADGIQTNTLYQGDSGAFEADSIKTAANYNDSHLDYINPGDNFDLLINQQSNINFIFCDTEGRLIDVTSEVTFESTIEESKLIKEEDGKTYLFPKALGTGTVKYNDGTKDYTLSFTVRNPDFYFISPEGYPDTFAICNIGDTFDLSNLKLNEGSFDVSKVDVTDSVNYADRNGNILTFKALGGFDIKYPNENDTEHPFMIHINIEDDQQGGGDEAPTDCYIFEYNGHKYKLGFGNGSIDENTMHIDGGSRVELMSGETSGMMAYLLIGELNDKGDISNPADASIYSLIKDINITVDYHDDSENISFKKENANIFDVDTSSIIVEANSQRTTRASLTVNVDFKDHENNEKHFEFNVSFELVNDIEIEFNSIEDLNNVLLDNGKLLEYLKNNGKIALERDCFDEFERINILLSGEFTGDIVCKIDSTEFYDLVLEGKNNFVLNGGISGVGITSIKNIKFKKNDSSSVAFKDGKAAILLNDTYSDRDSKFDIWNISDCTFDDYEYGIVSTGNSLISGIKNCTFTNCGTGIYSNSMMSQSYGDSSYDKFINCKTGIHILSIPKNCNAYQFVFRNMEFYSDPQNNYVDYIVEPNGNFFYTGNYYGTDSNNKDHDHLRHANIKYTGNNTKVYTNPCIRYPEETGAELGIDNKAGLYTGVVYGGSNKINIKDMKNIALDICSAGNGNAIASLALNGD